MHTILLAILSIVTSAAAQDLPQYPFTVLFLEVDTKKHACTGALIGMHAVLTSAFCLDGSKSEKCVAGDVSSIPKARAKAPFQTRSIKERLYHPEAMKGSDYDFNHAIAIAFMETPFVEFKYLKPIKLAAEEVTYNGMKLTAAGNGPDSAQVTIGVGSMSQCTRSGLDKAICGNPVEVLYKTRIGIGLADVKENELYGILVGETVERYEVYTSVFANKGWIVKNLYMTGLIEPKKQKKVKTRTKSAVSQLYHQQIILLISFLMGKFLFIICPF